MFKHYIVKTYNFTGNRKKEKERKINTIRKYKYCKTIKNKHYHIILHFVIMDPRCRFFVEKQVDSQPWYKQTQNQNSEVHKKIAFSTQLPQHWYQVRLYATNAKLTSPLLWVKNPCTILFIRLFEECFRKLFWITCHCCSYNLNNKYIMSCLKKEINKKGHRPITANMLNLSIPCIGLNNHSSYTAFQKGTECNISFVHFSLKI